MAVVLGDAPDPPMNLSWGNLSKKRESLSETYESLSDVGIDLEFEREGEGEWAGDSTIISSPDTQTRRNRNCAGS